MYVTTSTIGWLVRIKKTDKLNLSGTINVKQLTGNFINVSEYFDQIISDHPNPSVTKKVPATSAGIGLLGAYSFSPSIGLQFVSELAYGESFKRKETSAYFSGGLLGDVDSPPNNCDR